MKSSHLETHTVYGREKEGLEITAGVLDEVTMAKAAPLI